LGRSADRPEAPAGHSQVTVVITTAFIHRDGMYNVNEEPQKYLGILSKMNKQFP
jgi:hypothetical protein